MYLQKNNLWYNDYANKKLTEVKMFSEYTLTGTSQSELNTEVRYVTASAAVDKKSIFCLKLFDENSYAALEKRKSCLLKVLRGMKKEGIIEFFVTKEGFREENTEAVFLINKYSEYLKLVDDSEYVYVKL